jgi:Na+-translocating ferredoxin:NAD+ oxidoreductase RnfD subunit
MCCARGPDLYRYSPTFAVAVAPFAALPEAAGNAAWKLANVLVFLAGLWVWARRAVPGEATRARVARAFFVAAFAVMPSVFNGQVNLMGCAPTVGAAMYAAFLVAECAPAARTGRANAPVRPRHAVPNCRSPASPRPGTM